MSTRHFSTQYDANGDKAATFTISREPVAYAWAIVTPRGKIHCICERRKDIFWTDYNKVSGHKIKRVRVTLK